MSKYSETGQLVSAMFRQCKAEAMLTLGKTMALENSQDTPALDQGVPEGSWELFQYSLPDSQGTGMAPGVPTEALHMHSMQQALYKSHLDISTSPGKCPPPTLFSTGYL